MASHFWSAKGICFVAALQSLGNAVKRLDKEGIGKPDLSQMPNLQSVRLPCPDPRPAANEGGKCIAALRAKPDRKSGMVDVLQVLQSFLVIDLQQRERLRIHRSARFQNRGGIKRRLIYSRDLERRPPAHAHSIR